MVKIPFNRRYGNDQIYTDYEFEDETSPTDPLGTWNGSYYSRTYRCRVPRKLLESEKLDDWIANNSDKGIWL